jgi:hypothetical protein
MPPSLRHRERPLRQLYSYIVILKNIASQQAGEARMTSPPPPPSLFAMARFAFRVGRRTFGLFQKHQ